MKKLGGMTFILLLLFIGGCGSNEFESSSAEQTEGSEETNLEDQQQAPPIDSFLAQNYEFVETMESSSDPNDVSKVYRASGQSIGEVSNAITEQHTPREASHQAEDKQVLIYDSPTYFVVLTKDEQQPEDTMIELAEQQFVRDNFSPSFFDGLLLAWILDDVLDVDDWGKKQKQRCYDSTGNCYQGYGTTGSGYFGPSKPSSFRGYSSSVRGGGPGTGK